MVPEESKSDTGSSTGEKPQARSGPRRGGGGARRGRGRGRRGPKAPRSEEQERPQSSATGKPVDTEQGEQLEPVEAPEAAAFEEAQHQETETPDTAVPSEIADDALNAEFPVAEESAPEQRHEQEEPARRHEHRPHFQERHVQRQAPPAPRERTALTDAIQHVNEVIQSLKDALDDLDEVLETLELAERQKTFDEQEIESLKRSLRMLQRPKEQGRGPR